MRLTWIGALAVLWTACHLEDTPLRGHPVGGDGGGTFGDGDADADADADGDADGDGDGDGDTDADGDGDADCVDGAQQPCGSDVGACTGGRQRCAGGAWGPCEGGVGPQEERCDDVDQDCDGAAGPDDGDADGDCGFGLFCTRRQGRVLCAYYAPCIGCGCDEEPCIGDDVCDRPEDDCGLCLAGCSCAVCYRP